MGCDIYIYTSIFSVYTCLDYRVLFVLDGKAGDDYLEGRIKMFAGRISTSACSLLPTTDPILAAKAIDLEGSASSTALDLKGDHKSSQIFQPPTIRCLHLQHFAQDAIRGIPDASQHLSAASPALLADFRASFDSFRRQHGTAVSKGQEQARPSSCHQARLVLAVQLLQGGIDPEEPALEQATVPDFAAEEEGDETQSKIRRVGRKRKPPGLVRELIPPCCRSEAKG